TFGPEGALYALSTARSPMGEIVTMTGAAPTAKTAKTVVAASNGAISHSFYDPLSPSFVVAGGRIFVTAETGGPTELRVYDLSGKRMDGPKQEATSDVSGLTDAGPAGVLFAVNSYVTAGAWFGFDPQAKATKPLAISVKPTLDWSGVKVVREFAVS